MSRSILCIALVAAGCSGDDVTDPPQPATVLGALVERGPWMEDFVWGAGYLPCSDCEELAVIDFDADRYELTVYKRDPGAPATAALGCTAELAIVEDPIAGFDPRERTAITATLGDNDCGWTDVGPWPTWIYAVLDRDAGGAATRVVWWPEADADDATEFPGYINGAAPLILCESAPGTLCEPSCNTTTMDPSDCGLDQP